MRRLLAIAALFFSTFATAQTINLDQNWQLLPDPDAKYSIATLPKDAGWRPVRVGLSWNGQFDDMRDFGGVAWYRTIVPEQPQTDKRTLLQFAACDYFCEVFLNGEKVGEHEGGYTPFEFDISSRLKSDSNELIVRVIDPPRDPKRNQQLFPQFPYDEVPHGKQNWYVQTGGLWQPVNLKLRHVAYVLVRVSAEASGDIEVATSFASEIPVTLSATIRDKDGNVVAQKRQPDVITATGTPRFATFKMHVPEPHSWSPGAPYLYNVKVVFVFSNGETDSETTRFGFRSLTTHDGKLYLNGKPFYLIGALDQDFYPATIYTPPSPEYIRDEMRKAKALGLNTLRCHIKICTPDYLDAADEVGMLIWYEIPSWNDENHWTQQAADRGMHVFREALDRDWNHPSLAIQSIINESWGADLKQPDQRKWLAATYNEAKKLVTPLGRLIVDNSACCENFHVKSDLADFHQYYSIPDHADQWSRWVEDFASRPKWIWSPYGDAQPTGNEPLIVSEFGNWGLPKLPCGDATNGKGTASAVPTSAKIENRALAPEGHSNSMATPPQSLPNLERQGGNSRSSDDQIIRSSDCNLPWWFSRDFSGREITMPAGVIDRFHQFKLDRIFSSYNDLAEATQWHQFESLKYEIQQIRSQPNIQGYVITEFTDVNWESNGLLDMWRNPKVYAKELAQIQQQDASRINWKRGGPTVFPTRPQAVPPVALSADVPAALRQLRSVVNDAAPPLITSHFDENTRQKLAAGATVILLADSADALPANFPIQIKAREHSNYDGNWISNFNWILPSSPVFQDIAFNKIMGFEAQAVTPNYVLLGPKPEQFDDVLSGAFYGWIHNNSALLLQAKHGKGKLLITTFRFDQYGKDPYATHLLDNMIRYVASPKFAPKLDLK